MATLSGAAAIAWMRAHRTNVPGMCLNTCWQAYGSHNSIGPHAGQYPDAMSGWNYAQRRHVGDATPPPGVPVWFGVSPTRTDANARAGDVVISLGGGRVIGTDVGGAGRIGETTIAARAAAISRPFLGWTEDFLGYDIDSAATAALDASKLTPATPVLERIKTMALPSIVHQVNTKPNAKGAYDQAYIEVGTATLQIVSADYAASLARALGGIAIPTVNEFDMVAIKAAVNRTREALKLPLYK